jgi:phosphoserine phosphatase
LTEKAQRPVVAICYDFDKTLSPDDMQAQGFIQAVGYNVVAFWKESNELAKSTGMDQNLAWMYEMKNKAKNKTLFTKQALQDYGAQVKLFPGVEGWFDRIKEYGDQTGVEIEHYIISSGLKEMIEGTKIGQKFNQIFASSFLFNKQGVAIWPAQAVNYTNKTQFLFRIEKGLPDVNDQRVNDHFSPDQLHVPFRNMIYIGDSDTDVPCMKLVNSHGGYSIGVYNTQSNDKSKVYQMMRDERIKYFVPADYNQGQELDCLVKNIIERTAKNEQLERKYYACQKEVFANNGQEKTNEQTKTRLILALEASGSFAQTHQIVKQMAQMSHWTNQEAETIVKIAHKNSQVRYVANDQDIKDFLFQLVGPQESALSEQLKDILQ